MNIDQETYLSAYLDGELDSEPRSRVESALAADLELSKRLRELSSIRELVGSLSRPVAPMDVSTAVLARIEYQRVSGISEWLGVLSGTRTARVATLVAAASVLVVCALIGLGEIGFTKADHEGIAARLEISRDVPLIPARQVEPPSSIPSNVVAGNVGFEAAPVVESIQAPVSDPDAAAIRKLLANPQLDRVFMLTDVLGGDLDRQVGEILKTTARHSSRTTFGRIAVPEGIVIDSEHSGPGIGFAVVMNDAELREFQERMTKKYAGAIKVSALRSALVSKLSEAGASSLMAGRAASGLKDQPSLREEEASRALKGGSQSAEKVVVRDSVSTPSGSDPLQDPEMRAKSHELEVIVIDRDAPTPGQLRSGPHPSVRDAKEGAEAKSAGPRSSSTLTPKPSRTTEMVGPIRLRESLILVWITTSAPPSRTP